MHSSLHALPVLQDNVIWVWVKGAEAVVIDPAIASPVRDWLEQRQLTLAAVLQTHHHSDHIGGTPDLLKRWPKAEVIASRADRERIPFQTMPVGDGDQLTVLGEQVDVIDVAAHTRAHIAFFIPNLQDEAMGPVLFCGDTLFGAGCGRLFEGTAEQMHEALQKLAQLPEETKVCCAHEYTEANLQWAVEQRPEETVLADRLQEVRTLRSKGALSLPSSIGVERRTNLFLQAKTATELGVLRTRKDQWRPGMPQREERDHQRR